VCSREFLVPGALVAARQRASEKTVQPHVLVDNARVRMVRWVPKPGEGTPIHDHVLDHISVVIHGSRICYMTADGATTESEQKTGSAV
jgi:quercetin dioxygenase-like cupin family protein